MAITRDTLNLVAELRAATDKITDKTTNGLVAAWVKAWDGIALEVIAAIADLIQLGAGAWPSRTQVLRAHRTITALDLVGATMQRLVGQVRRDIVAGAQAAAHLANNSQGPIIASQLPYGSTQAHAAHYRKAQPDRIDAIVRRTAEQINAAHWPLADEATNAMKRELIRGVVVGDNPRDAAARMVKNLEGEFNGGLTRALVLSRTEILDAHRQAAEIGQADHADVLDGWTWLAEMNSSRGRTCPACFALHGTLHPMSEPGPQGHQQCRCSRAPRTKSWADLGFDIDEPEGKIPTGPEVFAGLPRDEQVAIMGPRRLELLDAGEVEWADLPVLRTTPEWRDSYGTRPVRDLERIAKQRANPTRGS